MRSNGRIFARKGTSFLWAAYYLRGREYRESTGETDPKKAEKFLKRRLDEVGADRTGARTFSGPAQDRVLVNKILDDLTAEYKLNRKTGIPREVGPQMESHLNRLRDYFGAMKAMDVQQTDVTKFIGTMQAGGKKISTINRALQLLGQAYTLACSSNVLSRSLKIKKFPENNTRKGKFSNAEAEAIFSGLPKYLADVARFAYETGTRVGEILKLRWPYVGQDAITVPAKDTKNRKPRSIALTPALEEIIERRRADRLPGCDLMFHHGGKPIRDYRKAWRTVCILNGLGAWYCRNCRGQEGEFISKLDANKTCDRCHRTWTAKKPAKYIGKIFHDFRRTAAHELWKAGNTIEDCMEVTGHATPAMFKRYADLFTEEEKQAPR
jgi:integrase